MQNIKIAIIGGGVGGMTCAMYARRANADVTIFEQYVMGGLTATIDVVENFPSYTTINGWQLVENMYNQVNSLGVDIKYEQVLSVTKDSNSQFTVTTSSGSYQFDSVVVATGTKHNKLGIEDNFVGKGVSYCATCDGNLYKGQPMAVAGNTAVAVKEALYLESLASKLYIINPTKEFVADQQLVDKLLSSDKVSVLYNSTITALSGQDKLEKIDIVDNTNNDKQTLDISALFVAVGSKPATDFLSQMDIQTNNGFIVTNDTMESSVSGLFAIGDVANGKLKQIVTACADGAKAGNYAVAYCKLQQRKAK